MVATQLLLLRFVVQCVTWNWLIAMSSYWVLVL
jgi:hypothetical protein